MRRALATVASGVGVGDVVGGLLDAATSMALHGLRSVSTDGLYTWENLAYVDGSENPKHVLDVYTPGGSSDFPRPLSPIVLWVHGGGWRRGGKDGIIRSAGAACARAGLVGVVQNYRLYPEGTYLDSIADISACLRWLQANAAMFGGDPSKIVLCGHSAGAHLVCLGVALPQVKMPKVAGVVGVSGVYNIPRLAASNPASRELLVTPVFGNDPQLWTEVSPCHYTGPNSPLRRVPVLLANAAADFHLGEDGEELAAGLGVPHITVPGRNHFSIVTSIGEEGDAFTAALLDFVRSQ